jgi:signal transduction histidine kinase
MSSSTDRQSWALADILIRRPAWVFAAYAVIGALALTALSWQNSKDIRETAALKAAEAYSQSVTAMRSFYSKHVVPRARNAGAEITHDYRNSDNAIPFPATLTIDLANELREKESAFTFRFYSTEPFPWRVGRELDQFERDALKELKEKGTGRYVRYENYKGNRSVRVAYPVVMGETCVACHNSHPQSPRTDWKPGDIRGVQQITLPLANVGASFLPDIKKSAFYIGIFALVGIVLIWLLMRDLQVRIEQTRKMANAAEIKNIELSAAKAEAERANRAQGELIANVSHELRTPLNSVIGFSEILKEERMGPLGSPEYPEFADEIYSSGTQLLEIINSILYMSQLESGSAEMQQEILTLDREIQDCLITHAAAREARDISIKPLIMPDLPTILFDRKALARIFHCIFDNAIKFTEPGGRIWIAAREVDSGDLEIRFKDTGAGISRELLQEVLKPFRQADGGKARRFEGVGLGLAMANSIAKLHNSRLEIESEVGVGTTVVLTIPANRVVVDGIDAANSPSETSGDKSKEAIAA